MDYQTVPFKRWHLAWVLAEGKAEGGQLPFDIETLMMLEKQNSWTIVVDGEPMACGGTMEQWPGRHSGWTYLNKKTGRHMGSVTKRVRELLDQVKGRVEITVREDFKPGHTWARMLGFEIETPVMKQFGPEGENHVGYVRFNER